MLSGDSTQFGAVRIGLRPKFIGAFAAVTIVIALIIVSVVQWRVRRAIDDQTLAPGQAIADTVKATAGYYVMFGLVDDLKKIIVDLRQRNPSIEYADFTTIDGHTLATSAAAPPVPLQKAPGALRGPNGELLHLFIVPFADEAGVTKGYFRLLVNHRQADAVSRQLLATEIGVTRLALAIAARAEIGALAETFNAMSGDLEKTMTKLVRAQTQLKSVADTVGSRSHTVIERVDEQRAVLDEAYQSIDQLNGGVRQITENFRGVSRAFGG